MAVRLRLRRWAAARKAEGKLARPTARAVGRAVASVAPELIGLAEGKVDALDRAALRDACLEAGRDDLARRI